MAEGFELPELPKMLNIVELIKPSHEPPQNKLDKQIEEQIKKLNEVVLGQTDLDKLAARLDELNKQLDEQMATTDKTLLWLAEQQEQTMLLEEQMLRQQYERDERLIKMLQEAAASLPTVPPPSK